eukprot:200861-Chlamydomonas_euryale.AAC.1
MLACLIPRLPAGLPARSLACSFACVPSCLPARLLARSLACRHACPPACPLPCLLAPSHSFWLACSLCLVATARGRRTNMPY